MAKDTMINMAVQFLPRSKGMHSYDLVDEAIEVIEESGLKHRVCPFETVVEGHWDELMKLLEAMKERCFAEGALEILVNIKLQMKKDADVHIEDKMQKYS